MKLLNENSSTKVIHINSRMACPIRQKDGTWKVVIKPFEEDIPNLGRDELICNSCGWPDYPKCKDTFCKAWVHHTAKAK